MAVPLVGAHGRKNSLRFSAAVFYYSCFKHSSILLTRKTPFQGLLLYL